VSYRLLPNRKELIKSPNITSVLLRLFPFLFLSLFSSKTFLQTSYTQYILAFWLPGFLASWTSRLFWTSWTSWTSWTFWTFWLPGLPGLSGLLDFLAFDDSVSTSNPYPFSLKLYTDVNIRKLGTLLFNRK